MDTLHASMGGPHAGHDSSEGPAAWAAEGPTPKNAAVSAPAASDSPGSKNMLPHAAQ